MKLKFTLLQILFWSIAFSLIAGIPPYKLFNYKDGYLGTNPINFFQDCNGFIWINSTSGLVRFDGSEFETYNAADGLISNEVVGMDEQSDSTLLISFRNTGIMKLTNQKFMNFYLNDKPNFVGSIILSGDAIYTYSYNFIHIIRNGSVKQLSYEFTHLKIDSSSFRSSFVLNQIIKSDNNILLAATSNGIYILEGESVKKVDTRTGNEMFNSLYIDNEGNIWAGARGKIILFDKKFNIIKQIGIEEYKDETVTNIIKDDYGNLWYSVSNFGLFRKTERETENISKRLGMEKVQINFIKHSRENNIWVGMYGKGIVCFYNLFIENFTTNYGLSNDFVTSLNQTHDGKLLIGTINKLNVLDSNIIYQIPIYSYNSVTYIKDVEVNDKTVFVCGSGLGKQYKNNEAGYEKAYDFSINEYFSRGISYKSFIGSCIKLLNDSIILTGMWNEFIPILKVKGDVLINNGRIKFDNDSIRSIRTDIIFQDKNNNYWIGTTRGLFLLNEKMERQKIPDNNLLKEGINEILGDNKDNLWISSKRGLILYNFTQNEFKYFPFGIDDKSLSDIAIEPNNTKMWIGSDNGLYKANIIHESLLYDKIFIRNNLILNESNGLASNEIKCLLYDTLNNVLWAGSNGGLSKIDIKKFNTLSFKEPKLYVKKIQIHDSVVKVLNNVELSYKDNDMTIYFSAINHLGIKDLSYRYRFSNEPEWKSLKENILQLASLSPGNYELQISCKSNLTEWSKPIFFNFSVMTPFWKSNVFYISIAILFISIVLIFGHVLTTKAVRRQAEKTYLINQLSELKHQALSAMLNPHFIFNAMNSIQSMISSGTNKELTNEYLSLFARLIRINLDLAQNTFITVDDEIERLKMYLELEKLRFGDKLNYKIKISPDIEVSAYKIPNMVMQPFVENSIWHGLQKNINDGMIEIKLWKDNIIYEGISIEVLMISISDNGIGIKKGIENKKTDHKSKGVSLIEERIHFLETEFKNFNHIIIEEKIAERGTIVTIILTPGLYIYNA